MNNEDPVLLHTAGRIRHITLNRPRAINALTHTMVLRIDEALAAAERDDSITAVLLSGAGERGLCAGGDIRAIYEDARAGGSTSVDFWRDEYRLNARIARFPKPYVALMDGIVMGGGVGVSAHAGCPYRHGTLTRRHAGDRHRLRARRRRNPPPRLRTR